MLSLRRLVRILSAPSRLVRRRRSRGFSHVSQTIEAAAIMGWFVILVLGEKYVSDATMARRRTEISVQESAVATAMGTCGGGGPLGGAGGLLGAAGAVLNGGGVGDVLNAGSALLDGDMPVSANVSIGNNGTMAVHMGSIPTLIAGLGLGSLRTLPNYFRPFQSTTARASARGVVAGAPLNFRSGDFEASRSLACLEPSLDTPGAPWNIFAESRMFIFITTILGYL